VKLQALGPVSALAHLWYEADWTTVVDYLREVGQQRSVGMLGLLGARCVGSEEVIQLPTANAFMWESILEIQKTFWYKIV